MFLCDAYLGKQPVITRVALRLLHIVWPLLSNGRFQGFLGQNCADAVLLGLGFRVLGPIVSPAARFGAKRFYV